MRVQPVRGPAAGPARRCQDHRFLSAHQPLSCCLSGPKCPHPPGDKPTRRMRPVPTAIGMHSEPVRRSPSPCIASSLLPSLPPILRASTAASLHHSRERCRARARSYPSPTTTHLMACIGSRAGGFWEAAPTVLTRQSAVRVWDESSELVRSEMVPQ